MESVQHLAWQQALLVHHTILAMLLHGRPNELPLVLFISYNYYMCTLQDQLRWNSYLCIRKQSYATLSTNAIKVYHKLSRKKEA